MCQHFFGQKMKRLFETARRPSVPGCHWLNDDADGYRKPQCSRISGRVLDPGFFVGPEELSKQRNQEIIGEINIDAACLDDPSSPSGCSADQMRLDRDRVNVLRISFGPLSEDEFAGVNIEEPEHWGDNP